MSGRQPRPVVEPAGDGTLLRDLARVPGGLWVTVAGRSMEPTLRLGDRVRVEACRRVRVGDVVLFLGSRAPVLHRVVARVPGTPWLFHAGDAGSGTGPGFVHYRQIIGRAAVPRRLPGAAAWWAQVRAAVRSRLVARRSR